MSVGDSRRSNRSAIGDRRNSRAASNRKLTHTLRRSNRNRGAKGLGRGIGVDVNRAVVVDRRSGNATSNRNLTNTLARGNRNRQAGGGAGESVSRDLDARTGVVHQGRGRAARNRELANTLGRGNRHGNL